MSTITSTGLGSGLDVNSLVDSITEAEKAPQQERIDLRRTDAQATISGVATLKSALSSFQGAFSDLADVNDLSFMTAASGDEDIFSATADYTAVPGSYSVEVQQLAGGDKYSSSPVDPKANLVTSATSMQFTVDGDAFSVTVGVNDTLVDLRNNINNALDNTGVSAAILTSDVGASLILTSRGSGAASAITIDVGATGLLLAQQETARDAEVLIDGQLVTSESNLVTGAITGVTLALDKADDNAVYTLSLFRDASQLEEQLEEFVDSYNSLLETVAKLQFGYEDEDGEPVAALMPNDSTLRSLMNQIRRTLSSTIENNGNFSGLASLGVQTNRDGTLKVDPTDLRSALDSGLDRMARLFAEEDVGIAYRLNEQINAYLKFEGVLDQRKSTAEAQLERLKQDQARLDLRIESFQARMFAQFNAMDSIVGLLGSTGSYLEQQLSALPFGSAGINANNK